MRVGIHLAGQGACATFSDRSLDPGRWERKPVLSVFGRKANSGQNRATDLRRREPADDVPS
jgi:hypothetical protein